MLSGLLLDARDAVQVKAYQQLWTMLSERLAVYALQRDTLVRRGCSSNELLKVLVRDDSVENSDRLGKIYLLVVFWELPPVGHYV